MPGLLRGIMACALAAFDLRFLRGALLARTGVGQPDACLHGARPSLVKPAVILPINFDEKQNCLVRDCRISERHVTFLWFG